MGDNTNKIIDAAIVGGGPAGLTAAIYLARFRRDVRVFDANNSRAAWVPLSHNHAGFPGGINGKELLNRMRQQATSYGARIDNETVLDLALSEHGFQVVLKDTSFFCRTIILAVGVVDAKPNIPNLAAAVRDGVLRYCPICDAYEAIDKNIVVLGHGKSGFGEACFLSDFSRRITVLTHGEIYDRHEECYQLAVSKGVKIIDEPIASIRETEIKTIEITFTSGNTLTFDTAYAAIGCYPRNELALRLDVKLNEDNRIAVDDHLETSVPNCFAAGDIVHGLNQISVAMGQAAIASVAIHNRLRQRANNV